MLLAASCDTPPVRSAKICTLMTVQSYCKWVAFSWHCPCLRIPQCRPKFCYCWRHLGINSPKIPKISLPWALTRITYDKLKELRDTLHLASEPRIVSHPREQGPASRVTNQECYILLPLTVRCCSHGLIRSNYINMEVQEPPLGL